MKDRRQKGKASRGYYESQYLSSVSHSGSGGGKVIFKAIIGRTIPFHFCSQKK
jgi:hypothetical protein